MKCPRCQHDNPQGARFCEECATSLAQACSNCGAALSTTAKFCHACAHPAAAAGTPSRSPESYTPKHLAEKILTSKAALEGERKQVGFSSPTLRARWSFSPIAIPRRRGRSWTQS
jgi:Double zinc ribbon